MKNNLGKGWETEVLTVRYCTSDIMLHLLRICWEWCQDYPQSGPRDTLDTHYTHT